MPCRSSPGDIQTGGIDEPAIGQQVPVVSGVDYEGSEIATGPAPDGPHTYSPSVAHSVSNLSLPPMSSQRRQ
jgi:hypothetical protein